MSLVILSNTQDEYIRRDNNNFVVATGSGISSPQSFINHFRSPLIIEPNSEVAVESVKINRGPTFDMDETNLFYLYYGRELINVNACESTKEPVPITIPRGSYTVNSMATALTDAINRAPLNPEVWGKYKVTVNRNASSDNIFRNFKVNQVSNTSAPANVVWTNASDEIKPANPVTNASKYTWSGGGYTLSASSLLQNAGSIILPKYPLSSCSGVLEVNFSSASGSWDIGLSRNTIANYNNGQPPNANVHVTRDDDADPFYDYVVKWDGTNIRLFHAVTGSDPRNKVDINMVEIDYENNTGAAPFFTSKIDAAKVSASGLTSVRFTLYGNGMECAIGVESGTFWEIASPINTKLNNTDRRYNLKPTNNANESLFPKFNLHEKSAQLVINEFNGLDQVGWVTPTSLDTGGYTTGSDWFTTQLKILPRRIRFIDGRDACRGYNASGNTTYSYSLLNASFSPDYNLVLITGQERDLRTQSQPDDVLTETYVIGFGDARRANMNNVLGSGDLSVLEQSIYGTGSLNSIVLTPPTTSEFMAHEGFVRVNNLTGVSYNGAKGSISKILYQIPRFDNTGRTEGNLYFAPGEKTYIALGNTESLILNQCDVDIVDRSERVVGDLVGSTVVVLYIRKVK